MDDNSLLIQEIKDTVSSRADLQKELSDGEIEDLITEAVFEKARYHYLSLDQKQELIRLIFNVMRRLGVLQPLLEDDSITEIMVNGPDCVFIERNGEIIETGIIIESREKLEDMIQSIVARVNRSVNEASPGSAAERRFNWGLSCRP